MPKKVTLSDEKVLDTWSVLIEKAKGKAEESYSSVLKSVEEEKMPNVGAEMVIAFPSGGHKLSSRFSESAQNGKELSLGFFLCNQRFRSRTWFLGEFPYLEPIRIS